MGTPEFAVVSLQKLLKTGHEVGAVVTGPDKKQGRGMRLAFSPVKKLALQHSLPVYQPVNLKDPQFLKALGDLNPDLILVVAFRILPQVVLAIPSKGVVNLHPSLLPKYRGAAPIHWALINGEKITGVTTMYIHGGVDAGNIILQQGVPIFEADDTGSLHDRLAEVGAGVLVKTLDLIQSGQAKGRPQDESQVSRAPKIFKDDCRIDWTKGAGEIHNFIRGLSPQPGAFTHLDGKLLKIFKTGVGRSPDLPGKPGEIVRAHPVEGLLVRTGSGIIALKEVQREGKKRLPIDAFLPGYRVKEGTILE